MRAALMIGALVAGVVCGVLAADGEKPRTNAPAKIEGKAQAPRMKELPPASPLEAELKKSRQELKVLRETHTLKHPEVRAKLQTIALLEANLARLKRAEKESTELQKAQEELVVMRLTKTEKHPLVQAQLRKIAELEKEERR